MTDVEVLCGALRKIGRESIALDIEDGSYPSGEEGDVVTTLMYCISAAENELARYYFPLKHVQSLSSQNGVYDFSAFEHTPVKILRVTSGGSPVKYTLCAGCLKTAARQIEAEYCYLPPKRQFGEEIPPSEMWHGEIAEIGAAAEYSLISGEPSVAQMWEERYRLAIDRARKTAADGMYIPPRRWV